MVAVAATAGQSIKMAETTARLVHSASRLISRLCTQLCIGLHRTRLSVRAPSVALHRALHPQALRPYRCASGGASGGASVALHCLFCVRVCVRVSKTSTSDASGNLPAVY